MTSATGTCTIDGLEDEVAKFILGLPEPTSETINEKPVNVYNYGDDMNPPYLGFMAIQRTMLNGVTKYRPVLETKTKFNIPGDDWATHEDQIDWQTQELSLSILRDDSTNRNWKRVFAAQDTESAAEEIIKGFFGISK